MGMMNSYQSRINGIVPNFRTTKKNENVEKLDSNYSVLFYGSHDNHCVGLVDMVNSTKISATLNDEKMCKYYSTFLNSAAATIKRFGGIVVKNVGDSLLYYFPQLPNLKTEQSFINCLEASLALVEIRDSINEHLATENFPELNYRVSADYGKVMFAESESTYCVDIFGPPVNMCTKINYKAVPNSIVIGGDLYEMVKKYNQYTFQKTAEYSLGFKNSYPIYTITRNKKIAGPVISGINSQHGESNVRSVKLDLPSNEYYLEWAMVR